MKLEMWLKIYEAILADFEFSREEDEKAARLMESLGRGKLLDKSVLEIIRGKEVAVIGGAYRGEGVEEKFRITAGKAINLVDFVPDIHVTDMEEDDKTLVNLEKNGCLLVLHAHGDNVDRIMSVVPKIGRFVGTTQSIPFNRVYNFGGFTDGDRAAVIAKRFGAKKIKLYGFDFERADTEVKKKKLKWARIILRKEGII
ncbi:6-hydroxymethylpterin diphosphokinase MptE-like protein [Archaeoglobus neptunius]|uniref:6-hydroxymethylpterin diphosphokinase MptE-like protein n=1 Tax=Archaeoglobus neptunius TaxID=2798580 RepID=UPI001926E6A2|nr:6-hydroxymethylpterin diphosphokinase MptE-like protein [Archaeoglobus neptunius]